MSLSSDLSLTLQQSKSKTLPTPHSIEILHSLLIDGAEVSDLHVRVAGNSDSRGVHRIQRKLQLHRLPVPSEAPCHQQQVHLQLRRTHLQLPRRQWLQYVPLTFLFCVLFSFFVMVLLIFAKI